MCYVAVQYVLMLILCLICAASPYSVLLTIDLYTLSLVNVLLSISGEANQYLCIVQVFNNFAMIVQMTYGIFTSDEQILLQAFALVTFILAILNMFTSEILSSYCYYNDERNSMVGISVFGSIIVILAIYYRTCLLYTSPSPRDS